MQSRLRSCRSTYDCLCPAVKQYTQIVQKGQLHIVGHRVLRDSARTIPHRPLDSLITFRPIALLGLSGQSPEVILAQEQGAALSMTGKKKELEADFGVGEVEGTLVLTDRRLIFVCTDEKMVDLPVGIFQATLIFSEVEEVSQIPQKPPNVFVAISSIESVKPHGGRLERPGFELEWEDGGTRRSFLVVQGEERKGKGLKDWVPIIENLRAGRQKLVTIPQPPSADTLEGRVVRVLSDMQEKGVLEIEEEVEDQFKVELDPDEVQAACDAMASKGIVRRYPDSSGDIFYRRASPLGEDDLSS